MPDTKRQTAIAAIERARDRSREAADKLSREGAPAHVQRAVGRATEDLEALLGDLTGVRRVA
jgi:predicted O-methyltransferase YrrM